MANPDAADDNLVRRLISVLERIDMKTVCAGLVLFSAAMMVRSVAAQQPNDLMRLSLPVGQLPAGCHLRPTGGAPVPTNPGIVTDPRFLGLMHVLAFGPLPEELAAQDLPSAQRLKATEDSLVARAARVEAGYAAWYREDGGFHEIGVFALRLKERSADVPATVPSSLVRITKGQVVIVSWADGKAASPDVGCVDVIRRHLASADVR